jgi:hypothetical protein
MTSAGANRHDSPLLAPTLQAASRQLDAILPAGRTCHLDRGYDSTVTRQLLHALGFEGQIARKGIPAPIQAGTRWVVGVPPTFRTADPLGSSPERTGSSGR